MDFKESRTIYTSNPFWTNDPSDEQIFDQVPLALTTMRTILRTINLIQNLEAFREYLSITMKNNASLFLLKISISNLCQKKPSWGQI